MLGTRLKEMRMKENLTQSELAKKLDVTQSTIGMFETNKRSPGYDTLVKIADFFNTSIDYLLGRTDDPSRGPQPLETNFKPEIRKIARAGEKMSPEKSQQMLDILEKIFPDEFKGD